jgi:hypothetical protein
MTALVLTMCLFVVGEKGMPKRGLVEAFGWPWQGGHR